VLILSTPASRNACGHEPLEEDERFAREARRADFAGDEEVSRKDFEVWALLIRALVLGMALAGVTSCRQGPVNEATAVLTPTDAPAVPSPVYDRKPRLNIVELEVQEKVLNLAEGVKYAFWTFGGHVPGKFIRVALGDSVELHLKNNAGNKLPHAIDLHAVTGPGGGAASSFVAPGQESQFTFKALNPGLYVYHCATPPVGMHVANGMYGLILVEPRGGLPRVDREYYLMQGDFYTVGAHGEQGLQAFDEEKAVAEKPSYIVFNGMEGSLVGDRALTARVGETVRLFVGNGGPNLTSSFHVIGEIFDRVYAEGGSRIQENVQTTVIPPGGATIVEFKVEVPGTYALVDHALFRAFNKGAIGELKVVGPEAPAIYSGPQQPRPLSVLGHDRFGSPLAATLADGDPKFAEGRAIYGTSCVPCHQSAGQGVPHIFPPLAGSDHLEADKARAIGIVLNGLAGPVTVDGDTFSSQMPSQRQLSDGQIAAVLSYVRGSFGNRLDPVTPKEVAAVRDAQTVSVATGAP
jgi:nitrite reductase (NO-forming)